MSMLLHRRVVVFVLAVVIGVAVVFVLPKATSAAPPEPFEVSFIEAELCDFPVLFEGSGKVKLIELPDGRIIDVAPGFRTTLTNLEEPDNQVTVHNTAAIHLTVLPNEVTLVVITGQILVRVFPEDVEESELHQGIYLAIGRTTWREDAEGNLIGSIRNEGELIDMCARLA
jgi:hypothetical protein